MVHSSNSVDWVQVATDAGAGVMILDSEGRICFFNPAASRVFTKRPHTECAGLRLTDLIRPSAADERLEVSRRVMQTGRPIVFCELWNGVALRATVRRLDNVAGAAGPAALWIYALEDGALVSNNDPDVNIVEAKHVDYGSLSVLTASELRVMALIGEGLSNAEVAARLHRAVKTVESHRAALTEKTGCSSRVELGAMARRAGLLRRVDLPDPAPSGTKASPSYYG